MCASSFVADMSRWVFMSDVCKHCALASCMEVCPTNAIIRTEFDTVYIQPSVCNGCRDCIAACPYHVIGFDESTGLARKCTFCYDRLQANLTPACAKACPTESIKFGDLSTMREVAGARPNTPYSTNFAPGRTAPIPGSNISPARPPTPRLFRYPGPGCALIHACNWIWAR